MLGENWICCKTDSAVESTGVCGLRSGVAWETSDAQSLRNLISTHLRFFRDDTNHLKRKQKIHDHLGVNHFFFTQKMNCRYMRLPVGLGWEGKRDPSSPAACHGKLQ